MLIILIIYLEVAKKLGLSCKPYYIRNSNSITLIIDDKLIRHFYSLNAMIN